MTDDRKKRRRDRVAETLLDVATVPDYTVLDPTAYADLASGIGDLFADARPNTDRIEAALEDVSLPETGSLDVDATVLPDSVGVDAADADAIIETGGETLAVAAETGVTPRQWWSTVGARRWRSPSKTVGRSPPKSW